MTPVNYAIFKLRLGFLALFTCVLALCFWPLIAFAADAVATATATTAQQKWWEAILAPVLSAVGLILATFITLGLRKLVQLLEAKYKIDIPTQVETLINDKAKLLVAWGEEKMENRLLHGDAQKTPGAQTITSVKDALWKFADSLGYGQHYTDEKLTQIVEGVLHLTRVGSEGVVGSTGERAQAVTAALTAATTPVVAAPVAAPVAK